jgi:hypothetical protein
LFWISSTDSKLDNFKEIFSFGNMRNLWKSKLSQYNTDSKNYFIRSTVYSMSWWKWTCFVNNKRTNINITKDGWVPNSFGTKFIMDNPLHCKADQDILMILISTPFFLVLQTRF